MKEPWFVTFWRAGLWIVPRVFLPMLFIASPIVAILGAQKPDSNAIAALHLNPNESALLIGIGGGAKCVGRDCSQVSTHTYLIWPGFSGASVTEDDDGLRVTPAPGAGFVVVLVWLVGGWCIWQYWLRPMTRNLRKPKG